MCPRCPEPLEDKRHIVRCQNPEAKELWNQSLTKLTSWLKEQGTKLKVAAQLINGLQCWYNGQDVPEGLFFMAAQQEVGTNSWLDGWIHFEWRQAQAKYWEGIQTCKSSKQWTADLIKKLWLIAWDQWEHQNGSLHNTTKNQQRIVKKDVNEQIQQVYQEGPLALPWEALPLMLNPVEVQHMLPLRAKQQWLESIKAAHIRKKEHDYGRYMAEQQFMEQWVVWHPRGSASTHT